MGWLIILFMVLVVIAGLWRLGRLDGSALQMVGAGLALALAGYAWQGRPTLAGSPGARPVDQQPGGETFAAARQQLLGQFDRASVWLTLADAYLRRGETLDAVDVLRSGIRQRPDDSDLWIGLGNALVVHSGGLMTPAADLAFRRAQALAPAAPGPRFFYGLSLAEGGRFAEAEILWRDVLATAPKDVSWRPFVEQKLKLLIQIRAIAEGRAPMPALPR